MKYRVNLYVTILATTLLLAACGGQPHQRQKSVADLVFTNGRVYTVDEERSWAQAVAISDGKIVYVGNDADARELVTSNTRVVDLQGKMLLPSFQDVHSHLAPGGVSYSDCPSLTSNPKKRF